MMMTSRRKLMWLCLAGVMVCVGGGWMAVTTGGVSAQVSTMTAVWGGGDIIVRDWFRTEWDSALRDVTQSIADMQAHANLAVQATGEAMRVRLLEASGAIDKAGDPDTIPRARSAANELRELLARPLADGSTLTKASQAAILSAAKVAFDAAEFEAVVAGRP